MEIGRVCSRASKWSSIPPRSASFTSAATVWQPLGVRRQVPGCSVWNRVLCTNRFGTLAKEEDECDAEEEYAAGLMDIPAIEISLPPPFLTAGVDGTQGCGCRPDQGRAKKLRRKRSKRVGVQSGPLLESSQQFSFDPCGNLAKEELYVHCRRVLSASFMASATSVLKLWWTAVRRKRLLPEASSQIYPRRAQ